MIDSQNVKSGAVKPAAERKATNNEDNAVMGGTTAIGRESRLSPAMVAATFIECMRLALVHVEPVPFLYIRDEDSATISVEACNGTPRIPRRHKGDYEITLLDLLSALLFFNMPVLLVGPTGVGKSFLLTQILNAVFGNEGYYYVRLERSLTGHSLMDPFLERTIVKKLPTTSIAWGKCHQYGGIFIDEPNRGDSQDTLQILDGTVSLNGHNAKLGLPIPGTNRLKPPYIVAAMNPNDARYSATEKVDGAVENRLLRVNYPANSVSDCPSRLGQEAPVDSHVQTWDEFRRQTGLKGGWREIYPIITDPALFNKALPDDVVEFIDLATSCLEPERAFAQNESVATHLGFQLSFAFRDDDDFKKIKEARKSLGDAVFSNRDLVKLRDLARAMALVRACKRHLKDAVVSIEDAGIALILLLENKRLDVKALPLLFADIVRDVTRAYKQLRRDFSIIDGYGLRPGIFQAAINFGMGKGLALMTKVLDANVKRLNTPFTSIADATMRARFIADFLSVRDFCSWNSPAVESAMKLPDCSEVYWKLEELYNKEGGRWTFDHLRLSPFFS
jgi:MoxR-like ATPase